MPKPLSSLIAALCGPACAQDFAPLHTSALVTKEPSMPPNQAIPTFERARTTDQWWTQRTDLKSRGLTIGGEYIAEFTSVFDGGINERGSFRNLLTLDAELDFETALGWEGGTLFLQYLSVNASSGGSADAGDIQVFSNLENARSLDVIYEMWYEQTLFDDRLRLKIGKVDANSEFDFIDAASDFSNSSAGFSPTIFAFPTYPDPATSINIFGTVVDNDRVSLKLGYGFYDGAAAVDGIRTGTRGPAGFFSDNHSDDCFQVAQAELRWERLMTEGSVLKDGRLSIGGWYHDGTFERFDGGADSGTFGLFVTGEIRLFDPDCIQPALGGQQTAGRASYGAASDSTDRGVYLFAQYGSADKDVSEVAQHFAVGVVWRGPDAHRPDDSLGVYASLANLSSDPGAGFDDDERVIDAYYRLRLTPAIFAQPEIQYIINPSGDTSVGDSLVAGIRIGVAF